MPVAIVAYVATLITLCALDAVWLTTMMPTYQHALGALLTPTPALAPAALFYLLYALGVVVLVVLPGIGTRRWDAIMPRGALFGLVAYGTYDLTNQATLRGWPMGLTVLDMASPTAWPDAAPLPCDAAHATAVNRFTAPQHRRRHGPAHATTVVAKAGAHYNAQVHRTRHIDLSADIAPPCRRAGQPRGARDDDPGDRLPRGGGHRVRVLHRCAGGHAHRHRRGVPRARPAVRLAVTHAVRSGTYIRCQKI
jgi:uncharacterized membrane protein